VENIRLVSYDIWLVEPSGRNPRKLTHWVNHVYVDFAWSPGSDAIAFTSEAIDPTIKSFEEFQSPLEQSRPDGLWIMSLDSTEPVKITPDRRYREVAWCPCGVVLAATMPAGLTSEIWLVAVDGSQLVDLANVTPDLDQSPVWSPDGTKLAFVSRRPGLAFSRDIWVMNADGSEPMNLRGRLKSGSTPPCGPSPQAGREFTLPFSLPPQAGEGPGIGVQKTSQMASKCSMAWTLLIRTFPAT
jgi:Tol biopolymer transport system component